MKPIKRGVLLSLFLLGAAKAQVWVVKKSSIVQCEITASQRMEEAKTELARARVAISESRVRTPMQALVCGNRGKVELRFLIESSDLKRVKRLGYEIASGR